MLYSPHRLNRILILLALCALLPAAQAKIVEGKLTSGLLVTADYQPGKPKAPSVLLIHGFLQTREFQTVSRLADGLRTAGYTTLSPTLSLGISRRARSLPCEAVHLHTMEQDVKEIGFWVEWLEKHHPGPIILVGHSFGSLQGLIYAVNTKHPSLRQIIALSLVDAEYQVEAEARKAADAEARKRQAQGSKELTPYPLGYCKKYVSNPQSYLSYSQWNRDKILKLTQHNRLPLDVIMGGKDERMEQSWPAQLRASGNRVHLIEGANHFFDAEFEFEVLDLTLSLIKKNTLAR